MSNTDHDAKIQALLKEVRLYKNPEELEELKKAIKKNVPFSMRGYFMAYLYATKFASAPVTSASSAPRQPKADLSNATSFYVNVGKASHCSPKELAAFICEKSGLADDAILSIAFKQNYSFVYVKNEKANGVIEAVSGQVFKGRKVKMNFSKESGTEQ